MASSSSQVQLSFALLEPPPHANGLSPARTPSLPPGTPGSIHRSVSSNLERDDAEERTLLDNGVVRDIVIGLSDGLTVPFALTAGLSSIGNSRIVVLGGVAELIAGAISMGIGGFLSASAERDHFRYLRRQTQARIQRLGEEEMGELVHEILGPVGINKEASRIVARELHKHDAAHAAVIASARASTEALSVRNMWGVWGFWRRFPHGQARDLEKGSQTSRRSRTDDMGLTAFLLKFGEGMEEVPLRRLYLSALTIGSGYFFGGLVPLLPYFFINPASLALYYSILITCVILLIFGAVKAHFTGAPGGWMGYLWGAISMLIVGAASAGSAFGIVRAIESRFGTNAC